MLRSAVSAFTRVFDALCLAAWCAADPGPICTPQIRRSRLCGAAQKKRAAPRPGHVWLMRGDAGISNPIVAAAISLKFEAY
jgi:hypothetical protein